MKLPPTGGCCISNSRINALIYRSLARTSYVGVTSSSRLCLINSSLIVSTICGYFAQYMMQRVMAHAVVSCPANNRRIISSIRSSSDMASSPAAINILDRTVVTSCPSDCCIRLIHLSSFSFKALLANLL